MSGTSYLGVSSNNWTAEETIENIEIMPVYQGYLNLKLVQETCHGISDWSTTSNGTEECTIFNLTRKVVDSVFSV